MAKKRDGEKPSKLIQLLASNVSFGKQYTGFLNFVQSIKSGKKSIMFAREFVVMDWETYNQLKEKSTIKAG